MDRRTSLYLYAWRNHIDVDYFPMQTAEAFSVPIGGTCAIALDPTKIRSEADEAVKLSHELGHCVYGGFYNKYTPFDVRAPAREQGKRLGGLPPYPLGQAQAGCEEWHHRSVGLGRVF